MEKSEVFDYPPANVINENEEIDYPIIRCEDCHEVLSIDFKMDKKQIILKCEKEGKTKNIEFKQFFEELKKYKDINYCQFCKKKNKTQKYYLCKTCSNKILCETCYRTHNKEDDVIKFKIDSTCKKHYNPYESYCPKCKENKCSYCSVEHDENHEKEEFYLKTKLIKKNKLDNFKNTIKNEINEKTKIELAIDSVIKELEEKIENLKKLKRNFFEYLNMKLKFIKFVLNNYEKKMTDFDINFYIIDNLQNQFNFNLKRLNFNNNNNNIDSKIENITSYLKENINSQFISSDKEEDVLNKEEKEISAEKEINVNYKFINKFCDNIIGFLDFNANLLCFYSNNTINFITKINYEKQFDIKEYGLDEIVTCKKINNQQILAYTKKNIVIIDIIDNNDYAISKRINFYKEIFDFNTNLDLLFLDYKYEKNNYYYYNNNLEEFIIKLIYFPNYNNSKFTFSFKRNKYELQDKLQFINDKIFIHFSPKNLKLYEIRNNECYLKNSSKIKINYTKASIFEINNDFYCLNDLNLILLLNKNDLSVAKTININSDNLGILKITDKLVSIFVTQNYMLYAKKYDISSNGLKWTLNYEKTVLYEEALRYFKDKNYILFQLSNYHSLYYDKYGYSLYEIDKSINEIQDNSYLDDKYLCNLI